MQINHIRVPKRKCATDLKMNGSRREISSLSFYTFSFVGFAKIQQCKGVFDNNPNGALFRVNPAWKLALCVLGLVWSRCGLLRGSIQPKCFA